MKQIYTLGIYLFSFGVRVYSLFNSKAQKIIKGHNNTFEKLKNVEGEYVWIHAASLGEFEQGRPIIESIKKKFPEQKVLLTFFSPSGYEARKNYELADQIFYLPFDTIKNANKFLRGINLKAAIFIKYEFWFNYLDLLQKKSIPTYYVSTIFRKEQFYFKYKWLRRILEGVTHFFVQDEESKSLLENHGIKNASIAGDTRLDSVIKNAGQKWKSDLIEAGLDGRPVIVFGSTWSGDHDLISAFINKHATKYQYIIAPHEIKNDKIEELKSRIILDVSLISKSQKLKDVIIIDSIGILKFLYRYADVVYIGGGFNKGIHNTLEPLAYGVPVLFGPSKHQKFPETRGIKKEGLGGLVLQDNFEESIQFYCDSKSQRDAVKKNVEEYVKRYKGATAKVMDKLKPMLES